MKRGIVPTTAIAPVAPVSGIAPVSSVIAPSVGVNSWGPGVSITGEPIRPMLLNQDISRFSTGYVAPVSTINRW